MLRCFVAATERLSRFAGVLAAVLLMVAMVIVCQMIFMRYVFSAPTSWQTEVVVFSATAAIFIGAPYVLLTRGHVGVEVIELLLRDNALRRLKLVASFLGLAFCAIMAVASGMYWYAAWDGGWTTPTIDAIPLWIPLAPMVLGFVLLSLQYLVEILKIHSPGEYA